MFSVSVNPLQAVLSPLSGLRPPLYRYTTRISQQQQQQQQPHRGTAAAAATATEVGVLCPESLEATLAAAAAESPALAQIIRNAVAAAEGNNEFVSTPAARSLASSIRAGSSSNASHETFEENKREPTASMAKSPSPSSGFFLSSGLLLRPALIHRRQHVRGFKSRRAHEADGVPFKRTTTAASNEYRSGETESVGKSKDASELTQPAEFLKMLLDKQKSLSQPSSKKSASLEDTKKSTEAPKASNEVSDKLLLDVLSYKVGYMEGTEKQKEKSEPRFKSFLAYVPSIVVGLLFLGYVFRPVLTKFIRPMGPSEIAPEDINVTFDDVRGCDEAKQDLQEIVEFLSNPQKFSALGGKLPKGCLLVGPPGTGKTLLARAVAGQAGVPFFQTSGSEFEEVLVGQGARRIRDLFRTAKERAPCVIFIDEIDSVGSMRTSNPLHPYANQTINQLLSEMDGFLSSEGVIVIGATNRVDSLDKALLRPGRFDAQVTVPKPDIKGRMEILELYVSRITHKDIDIHKLARRTVGFTGADLENMVNTAAIRAAIEGHPYVTMAEFEYSHDKHVLGTDWKSRVRDKEDLRITAYHEAGHALVSHFTKNSTPLYKVTIGAIGETGGHTSFIPEKDRTNETLSQMVAHMDTAMGGRAAEEVIFGKENITSGAYADLRGATRIVRTMVQDLGMSDALGLHVVNEPSEELGPQTREAMDAEMKNMLNASYARAVKIIQSNRSQLDSLAEMLLKYETLDADDVKAIIAGNADDVDKKLAKAGGAISLRSRQQQLASRGTKLTEPAASSNPSPNPTATAGQ